MNTAKRSDERAIKSYDSFNTTLKINGVPFQSQRLATAKIIGMRVHASFWCFCRKPHGILLQKNPMRFIASAFFVFYPFTAANPFSRSAMISSMCSVPMERRIVLGRMP